MPTTTKVPYFDLKRQYSKLQSEIEAELKSFLSSGSYVLGQPVQEFESNFAQFCGSPHGIGVGSGTDALFFALRSLDIQDKEVIVPAYTFVATVYAILHAGGIPVPADVDPATFNLDPKDIESRITKKTAAILPVHLYGQMAEMDIICSLAHAYKLKVVEDAAQAHGALFNGKRAGAMGDLGCFSFYPTKNLGAFGDGGMVVTHDEALAKRIRQSRNLGREGFLGDHEDVGWTSRLDGMQAIILNIKLKYLDEFNVQRNRVAKIYHEALADTPLILPKAKNQAGHVYHLYVVRVPDEKRNDLQSFLKEHGVTTLIHYPTPIHQQPFFEKRVEKGLSFPNAEKLCSEVLTLPLFPEMTEEEALKVSELIHSYYQKS